MKQNTFSKKIISAFLCIALVFSFFGLFASQSTAEGGGSYTWRVRVNVGDNFDSTSDGSSKRSYFTLKGAEDNGKQTETTVINEKKVEKNIITDYDDGTDVYLTNLLSGGDIGATKSSTTYTTTYFPTYFYMNLYKTGHAGFGNAKYTVYLEVRNSSGNWITLCSDSASKTGGWGDMYNSGTTPNDKLPKVTSVSFTKAPPANIQIPRSDEDAYNTELEAAAYDQYGVLWYTPPTITLNVAKTGVNIISNVLYVTSDANSVDGSNSSFKIDAMYQTVSTQKEVALQNAVYTYEFQDEAGNTIEPYHGSLKYGQTVPKPADLTKAYTETEHYTFEGWLPQSDRLLKDTVYRPSFSAQAHIFGKYKSDENATCTHDGTKTARCQCGKSITVEDPGTMLEHVYRYEITQEPTCTEPGKKTATCINCGASFEQEIAPLTHHYVPGEPIPPTCTEQGYTVYTCEHCGDSYEDDFVESPGHSWLDGVVTEQPTCTQSGLMSYECSVCHETRTETIDALDHNFGPQTVIENPTCTEPGESAIRCLRCGYSESTTIPALDHNYGDWIQEYDATCESGGRKYHVCSRCSNKEYYTIAPLKHAWELKQTAPGNGKAGKLYYVCTRDNCGKGAICNVDESGEKSVGMICEAAEASANATPIPATSFNSINRVESGYNYRKRGASLRIDKNTLQSKYQSMRFAASMLVPDGVELLDFGYIYTRGDCFDNLKTFVIGGDNVYDFSLKNGNHSTFQTAQGIVKTFNIVINVCDENWGYDFVARPYITYRFAGETFTVYDSIYTSRSVNYIASQIMENPNETKMVKDYIQAKIIDHQFS